tara:strand:+ start:1935 stop:2336 length:402 start_codon:yes stop_codon:yes gene_type:complete
MSNILIATSVVLNGILLAFLFGLVPFFLYLSMAFNILLLWYTRRTVDNAGDIESDLLEVLKSIEAFSDNLDELHGMEMFYGEPILQDLINHSRSTNNDIIDVLEKYYEVRAEEIDEHNEQEEAETEEEEPILY